MNNILVTGGAGFIGSNLTLELQSRFPEARIVVVDDFRSGDFRNLRGFRGDFVTADVSRLDWSAQFRDQVFDAIFHEASITDTTVHDQALQSHDNIEGFRRLLRFAEPHQTPVVYASSAATYGICSGIQTEDQPRRPPMFTPSARSSSTTWPGSRRGATLPGGSSGSGISTSTGRSRPTRGRLRA